MLQPKRTGTTHTHASRSAASRLPSRQGESGGGGVGHVDSECEIQGERGEGGALAAGDASPPTDSSWGGALAVDGHETDSECLMFITRMQPHATSPHSSSQQPQHQLPHRPPTTTTLAANASSQTSAHSARALSRRVFTTPPPPSPPAFNRSTLTFRPPPPLSGSSITAAAHACGGEHGGI